MAYWEDRSVLITGVSGFTGRHLASDLQGRGARVAGFDLSITDIDSIEGFTGSLLDPGRLDEVIAEANPAITFHLAGIIRTETPGLYYGVNAGGSAALLEALTRCTSWDRVVVTSSSAVYGLQGADRPIREQAKLMPITSYGHSKMAMESIAWAYGEHFEMPIVVCRPFNLVGPGLNAEMVLSAFARQIVSAEQGEIDAIRVGNLDSARDFLDVRDGVRAYRLLAEAGRSGEPYNVCSGRAVTIRDCLEMLLGLSDAHPRIIQDPGRRQKDDVPVQVGDPAKINAHTGWEPRIPLEQSLRDLLDDHRGRKDARV